MRRYIAIALIVWFAFLQAPAVLSTEFKAFVTDLEHGVMNQTEAMGAVAGAEGGVKEKAYALVNRVLPGLEHRIAATKAAKAPGYQELKLLQYGTPDILYQEAKVYSVIDGDTIYVLIDGRRVKVRMIGVNTAECAGTHKDNPEPFSLEAKGYTESILTKNRTVYLVSDEIDKDKYGRLLRYVWLNKPDYLKAYEDLFNSTLLRDGCAKAMPVEPNTKYESYFDAVQKDAQKAKVGIWSDQ